MEPAARRAAPMQVFTVHETLHADTDPMLNIVARWRRRIRFP
jgi:hypothetical protein